MRNDRGALPGVDRGIVNQETRTQLNAHFSFRGTFALVTGLWMMVPESGRLMILSK